MGSPTRAIGGRVVARLMLYLEKNEVKVASAPDVDMIMVDKWKLWHSKELEERGQACVEDSISLVVVQRKPPLGYKGGDEEGLPKDHEERPLGTHNHCRCRRSQCDLERVRGHCRA